MHPTVPAPRGSLRPATDRPTVLLTGASGVVGQGLLPRLAGYDVVCLVHRTPVPGHRSVRGDLSAPRLGLDERAWRELAARVDVVVHSAALTQFTESDEEIEATNVRGVRHVLDLAARAGAPVHHVSTAYVHARAEAGRGERATRYAASKRAGDELVRGSGLPHSILRPSVVIGDAATGETSGFQGLHKVAEAVVRGSVPILPFEPTWTLDVVPRDTVADAAAALVRAGGTGEHWLTSGDRAPTLAQAVDVVLEVAEEAGLDAARPRFVSPETYDRLIAPVFLGALPPKVRRRTEGLLDTFSSYLSHGEPLPSSLPTVPDPLDALRASLRWWVVESGLATPAAGERVA